MAPGSRECRSRALSGDRHLALAFGVGIAIVATALAQSAPAPLTLHDAANIALEKNPLRKATLADTKAAAAEVREAQSFLLPHVTFSEQATRGNDPVYVFVSKVAAAAIHS